MLCVFCLTDGMDLKYDKRGRPYLACAGCGTKVFSRGLQSIGNYAVIAESLKSLNLDSVRQAGAARVADHLAAQTRAQEVQRAGQPRGETVGARGGEAR